MMAFSLSPCSRSVCIQYSKLDPVKTTGTQGKINAIWWYFKINVQKLADICGYELPTNLQNFTQKTLNRSENIPKSFRGLLFLKPLYRRTTPHHRCNKCSNKKLKKNAFATNFLSNVCERWLTNVEYWMVVAVAVAGSYDNYTTPRHHSIHRRSGPLTKHIGILYLSL